MTFLFSGLLGHVINIRKRFSKRIFAKFVEKRKKEIESGHDQRSQRSSSGIKLKFKVKQIFKYRNIVTERFVLSITKKYSGGHKNMAKNLVGDRD